MGLPEVVIDDHPLSVVVVHASIVKPQPKNVRDTPGCVKKTVALVNLLLCKKKTAMRTTRSV